MRQDSMKNNRLINVLGGIFAALLLGGCSATVYSGASSVNDDLYAPRNRSELMAARAEHQARVLAEQQAAEEAEQKRREEIARTIADLQKQEAQQEELSYSSVLSDGIQDSYERRLRGINSPSYKMPSSYADAATSTTARYASAYDPAFYNVMVSGDEIWVEPKYVSSFFGDWGATNVTVNLGLWGYPSWTWWNSPWWWGWSPTWSWNWNWGWNHYGWYSPWYNDFWFSWGGWYPYYGWGGWYGPHWPHGPHYWGHGGYWGHPKYNSHNTVYGKPRNSSGAYYPSYMGGSGNSSYRRGSNSSFQSNGTGISTSSGSASYRRGTVGYDNSGNTSYRNDNGTKGNTSSSPYDVYRRQQKSGSSSSSSYMNGTKSSGGTTTTSPSYRRGTTSPAPSSSGSFNRGSFGGGSFGGGSMGGGGGAPRSGGGSYRR